MPGQGTGDPGLQPPVLHRQRVPAFVVRRRVTFVAKAEYFESWKTAWFFRAVGMIPLKREGGPHRSGPSPRPVNCSRPGGSSGSIRRGPARPTGACTEGTPASPACPNHCAAPVVPVAQFGTGEVQPIGAMWPKLFRRVDIRMGTPCAGMGPRAAPDDFRQFTDQLMAAIQRLSGQERVTGTPPATGAGVRSGRKQSRTRPVGRPTRAPD